MNRNIELKYLECLHHLIELQDKVKWIHPLLQEHFPIVIVENSQLNIFEYDNGNYYLSLVVPDTMNLPLGIRVAFPLQYLQNKAAVVVTGEVFDTISDQVIIFHEFAHCYQYHTCEMKLRESIELAKRFDNTSNYSWELDYKFPYSDSQYIENTKLLFESLNKNDHKLIDIARRNLKKCLSSEQVEYMVWQEWKEGFARYIENQIKLFLGISTNHGGREEPFRRGTFYEMGSQLISLIVQNYPDSLYHIEELYYAIQNDLYFNSINDTR